MHIVESLDSLTYSVPEWLEELEHCQALQVRAREVQVGQTLVATIGDVA